MEFAVGDGKTKRVPKGAEKGDESNKVMGMGRKGGKGKGDGRGMEDKGEG